MKRAGRLLCGAALLAALGGAGWGAALLLEREAFHRQRLRDLEAANVDLRAELTRQRSENDRLAAETHCGTADRDALARRLAAAKTARELHELIPHLQKAIAYAQANVSPAAVCGYLEWELQKK